MKQNWKNPFKKGFVVEPTHFKSCLVSSVYGENTEKMKLKVINDSDSYRLFKPDIFLGQAEPAIKLATDKTPEDQVTSSTTTTGSLPEHLGGMYKNSSVDLDEKQKIYWSNSSQFSQRMIST